MTTRIYTLKQATYMLICCSLSYAQYVLSEPMHHQIIQVHCGDFIIINTSLVSISSGGDVGTIDGQNFKPRPESSGILPLQRINCPINRTGVLTTTYDHIMMRYIVSFHCPKLMSAYLGDTLGSSDMIYTYIMNRVGIKKLRT